MTLINHEIGIKHDIKKQYYSCKLKDNRIIKTHCYVTNNTKLSQLIEIWNKVNPNNYLYYQNTSQTIYNTIQSSIRVTTTNYIQSKHIVKTILGTHEEILFTN